MMGVCYDGICCRLLIEGRRLVEKKGYYANRENRIR
jgi:hypothetical protein